MEITASQIAYLLNGTVEGDPEAKLHTVARIEDAHPGALTFLSNPKYETHIYTTTASAVLVRHDFVPAKELPLTLIRVGDPYQALAKLLTWYEEARPVKRGIHHSAIIDESAQLGRELYIGAGTVVEEKVVIGDRCVIHPQVYIGENVTIGKNCILHPGVRICRDSVIGDNCIFHPGAVIGSDGFGFAPVTDADYIKIPQIGNVVIEDNVEIGSNTCIDRATMGSTIIRKGVKLDNLIQVGHNCEIGENTVIAAQSGLAGSSRVGKNCMFGGQVGLAGHLTIADGCRIGAQSGVMSSITTENAVLLGYPATESRQYLRSFAHLRKLPDLSSRLDTLEKRVESLKNR